MGGCVRFGYVGMLEEGARHEDAGMEAYCIAFDSSTCS